MNQLNVLDTSSCRHLNANCADKISCHLQCDGTSTCRNAKLSGSWNLDCSGTSSYHNLNANCADKKPCHSLCDGTYTCRNAKLYGSWDLDCSGMSACQGSYVQNPYVWIGPVDLTSSESNSNIQRPSSSVKNLSGSVQRPSSAQTTIFFAIFLSIVLHL